MEVLVAVDMGPGSDKLLGFAARLAKETGGKIHVVHIITEEEEEDRRHKPGSSSEALDEVLRVATDSDAEQREYVDEMLAKTRRDLMNSLVELGVAEPSITAIARTGKPVDEIQRLAAEKAVDALVLGLRRRSRVGKFLLGSDLQDLLLSSDRPVIAVPIGSVGHQP